MQRFKITICLMLILLCFSTSHISAQSSKWNFKNRVQLGLEWDDNVYETRNTSQAEPSMRLLFQTRGEKKKPNAYIGFRYSGGYQGYQPLVKEDKVINELTLQTELKLSDRLNIGLNGWTRLKLFLYKPINYHLMSIDVFTRLQLPFQSHLVFHFKPHYLNYRSVTFFDYHGYETCLAITKYLSNRLSIEAGVFCNSVTYKREAYFFLDTENTLNLEDAKQKDKIQTFYFNIRHPGRVYWSLSYFYEINNSNSYGFSYFNRWLLITLSKKLPYDLLLRLHSMIQKKNYEDPLAPYVQIGLDTEKEDSNYLIIDISRSFAQKYSAFLRLAWYQNESLFRARYYQKQIAMVGLEYRF